MGLSFTLKLSPRELAHTIHTLVFNKAAVLNHEVLIKKQASQLIFCFLSLEKKSASYKHASLNSQILVNQSSVTEKHGS